MLLTLLVVALEMSPGAYSDPQGGPLSSNAPPDRDLGPPASDLSKEGPSDVDPDSSPAQPNHCAKLCQEPTEEKFAECSSGAGATLADAVCNARVARQLSQCATACSPDDGARDEK